jgi:hypothetical protein
MRFKDGDIEKTIVFNGVKLSSGETMGCFHIEIDGAFQFNVFSKTIFSNEKNVFFETWSDTYKNLLSKQPEVMDWMKQTHMIELEKLRNVKIDSWCYSGFGSHFSISPNGVWELRYARKELTKIAEVISDFHVCNHGEILNKMDAKSERVEWSPGRFESKISNDDLMEIYNEIIEGIESREQEKRNNEEAKKEAIFNKAKETGEPQLLVRWTENCNDPKEECNTDLCCEWAMPDGTTKYDRTHTW